VTQFYCTATRSCSHLDQVGIVRRLGRSFSITNGHGRTYLFSEGTLRIFRLAPEATSYQEVVRLSDRICKRLEEDDEDPETILRRPKNRRNIDEEA